jgi:hypothetical protein
MPIPPAEVPAETAEAPAEEAGSGAAKRAAHRRGWLRLGAVAGLVAAASLAVSLVTRDHETDDRPSPRTGRGTWTTEPYRGLGAWIDVFDYLPSLASTGSTTPMQVAEIAPMRAFGTETLFLQAATTSAGPGVADEQLVGRFLVAAHDAGMAVVAWYLPYFGDLASDLGRIQALRSFEFEGHRFDGLAVDIEWTSSVPDPIERSRRLVELSKATDAMVGGEPLGAIVMPPVQIEDVNPAYWPGFPWAELAGIYDIWMPMSYWTFRGPPWDQADVYTEENIRRIAQHVGVTSDRIHAVGGVADEATEGDMRDFMRAVTGTGVAGWSVYDFRTLTVGGMAALDPTR